MSPPVVKHLIIRAVMLFACLVPLGLWPWFGGLEALLPSPFFGCLLLYVHFMRAVGAEAGPHPVEQFAARVAPHALMALGSIVGVLAASLGEVVWAVAWGVWLLAVWLFIGRARPESLSTPRTGEAA